MIKGYKKSLKGKIIHCAIISLAITILLELLVMGVVKAGKTIVGKDEISSTISTYKNKEEASKKMDSDMLKNVNREMTDIRNGNNNKQNTNIVLLVVALVCGGIIFTCTFILLLQKQYEYLMSITEGIDKIVEGDYSTRLPVYSDDEFSVIADKLNTMSESIQNMIRLQKENEDSKNYLITSVAHDLRTPLTSIIGYIDLIRMEQLTDLEKKKEYLNIAYNKSKRLQSLIEDLFTYTQFSFGKVKPQMDEIDMVKFIEQIAEEFYPLFKQNDLEYQFYTSEKKALLVGDGDLLARVFANLYSNAIKYGKDGKRVETYLEVRDSKLIIKVVNYGQLIPKEDITHIFERFYRVENSRSNETGGIGLGLAIAKNIVNMHGGTINAKSDIEGTVFTIVM